MTGGRRAGLLAAGLTGLAAFLPFAAGVLAGGTFCFRDLGRQFFPLRRFAAEGLRQGELRWWNPYEHEGVPMSLPPLSYPLDLLQALWPDERGLSLLLALHVPLAALAFFALARGLGVSRPAAAVGGLCYALGGFALSCLNLYIYVQALAWAPLAVLGLARVGGGGWPRAAAAAVPLAVCLSTTGVEIAAQAALLGMAIALARAWRARTAGLAGGALLLAAALAAVPLVVVSAQVAGSARGDGFATEVVLGHSVHPLTFLQTVVAGLYGDPSRIVDRWWGQNFFPLGFPYFLSLYLGAVALSLAVVGAAGGGRLGRLLAVMAALAAVVCLGRWAGLEPLVERLPPLRGFRFPSKAFFSVHASVALLAALGAERLHAGLRPAWRLLALTAGTMGLPLVLAAAVLSPALRPVRWFMAGFFPPEMAWAERAERLAFMARDASAGGALALAVAALALLVLRGRLRPGPAVAGLAAVLGADLIRAGAGLNPMVPLEAARPSPEVGRLAEAWRQDGHRIFTCPVEESPAYHRGRETRRDRHALWSVWTLLDTLSPAVNVPLGVPSAYGVDRTMMVPLERVLPPGEGCRAPGLLAARLRAGAVAHVLSLDPLPEEELRLAASLAIPRLAPLRVHVYELPRPQPIREVREGRVVEAAERPGWMRLAVEASRPTELILRQGLAGWTARVDGRAVPLRPVEGRYGAVAVPAGRSEVVVRYRPPGLAPAAAVSLAALALISAPLARSAWARRRAR